MLHSGHKTELLHGSAKRHGNRMRGAGGMPVEGLWMRPRDVAAAMLPAASPSAPRPGSASSAGPDTPEQLCILLLAWWTSAGLLALEMTYFSTIFKKQLTVGKASKTVAAFTRCLVLSPLFSRPCKGWAAGIRAQVPAELGQWGQIWQVMVLPETAQDPLEAGQPGEGLWGAK